MWVVQRGLGWLLQNGSAYENPCGGCDGMQALSRASRFTPYMKTVRAGITSGSSWVNGELDPKAAVPPSDAVYFSLLEQEAEVEPKELLSQSSQITSVAKNAALGAHLIKELSKWEEAKDAGQQRSHAVRSTESVP